MSEVVPALHAVTTACMVSPIGTLNHSWEKWLLLAPSLACDLGKSLTLFLLTSVKQGCTVSSFHLKRHLF